MANQSAALDPNHVPSLLGASGTIDTAETRKITTESVDGSMALHVFTLNPPAGASGTTVEVNDGTLTDVTITLGTVEGVNPDGDLSTANPVLIGGLNGGGTLQAFQAAPDGDQVIHQHSEELAFPDNVLNTQHTPVNETDSGFMVTPVFPYHFDGSTWDRARGDSTDGMLVNMGDNNDVVQSSGTTTTGSLSNIAFIHEIGTMPAMGESAGGTLDIIGSITDVGQVHNAGTVAALPDLPGGTIDTVSSVSNLAKGTITSLESLPDLPGGTIDVITNLAGGTANVSGVIAHDAVDAGNPVKVGGKAFDFGSNPISVAGGDRTDAYFTRAGQMFTIAGHPNIQTKNLQVTDADGAKTNLALVSTGSGGAIVVTKCSVMADNGNTTDVSVRIGFGTTTTPGADAADVIVFHPGIAAGSGVVEGTGAGIIGYGASDEDLRLTCEDPVGGSISIIVTYFTIPIG